MSKIPTRLLVQQRLAELLETLVDADGLEINMAGAVFRNRTLIGSEANLLPCISILESPRPDIATYAGEEAFARLDNLTLLITGMVEDDLENPGDEAHLFVAAVEARLSRILGPLRTGGRGPEFPEHFMLGDLITKLEIAPPVVRPPEDKVSKTAFFFLPIRVGIAVKIGDPYTTVT